MFSLICVIERVKSNKIFFHANLFFQYSAKKRLFGLNLNKIPQCTGLHAISALCKVESVGRVNPWLLPDVWLLSHFLIEIKYVDAGVLCSHDFPADARNVRALGVTVEGEWRSSEVHG